MKSPDCTYFYYVSYKPHCVQCRPKIAQKIRHWTVVYGHDSSYPTPRNGIKYTIVVRTYIYLTSQNSECLIKMVRITTWKNTLGNFGCFHIWFSSLENDTKPSHENTIKFILNAIFGKNQCLLCIIFFLQLSSEFKHSVL